GPQYWPPPSSSACSPAWPGPALPPASDLPCKLQLSPRALRALRADPSRELYGVQIGDVAGLPSRTVHPMLARLEGVGWVQSQWEDIDVHAQGRPARRYY